MVLLLIMLRHQTWWPGMDAMELVWEGWIPTRSVSRGEHPGTLSVAAQTDRS